MCAHQLVLFHLHFQHIITTSEESKLDNSRYDVDHRSLYCDRRVVVASQNSLDVVYPTSEALVSRTENRCSGNPKTVAIWSRSWLMSNRMSDLDHLPCDHKAWNTLHFVSRAITFTPVVRRRRDRSSCLDTEHDQHDDSTIHQQIRNSFAPATSRIRFHPA